MKKFFKTSFATLMAILAFSACTEQNNDAQLAKLQVKVNMPDEFTAAYNGDVTITSDENGKTYTVAAVEGNALFEKIYPGMYDIQISKTLSREEAAQSAPNTGIADKVILNGVKKGVAANLEAENMAEVELTWAMANDLLITKIYCNGTVKNDGNKKYGADAKFYEITNNSEETKYLDGLCVAVAHGMITSGKPSALYLKDKDATYVSRILRFPGTEGVTKDYPIEGGKTITLAWSAQNFIVVEAGKNQCTMNADLTGAEFEMDNSGHSMKSVDNPDVPNIPYAYDCYTEGSGFFDMNHSLLIFYASQEQINSWETGVDENSYSGVDQKKWLAKRVPNTIILDAVETYKKGITLGKRIPDALDAKGVCGADYSAVVYIRKIEKKDGNRLIFKDTNNSENDFVAVGSKGNYDGSHLLIHNYSHAEIQPAK